MQQNELPRILIADNDEHILLSLERTLEDEGYATTTAVTGRETIQTLSSGKFDLLVLDDCLSDAHCVQILAHCHSAGERPQVVVTYYHFPSLAEQRQLHSLGVNILVDKRDHAELLRNVRQMLQPTSGSHREFGHLT